MKKKLSVTVDDDVIARIEDYQERNYNVKGFNWSQLIEHVLRTGIEVLEKKKDASVTV